MNQRDQAEFVARLWGIEDALVKAGFAPMPQWWREQLTRFYMTGKRRFTVRKGRRVTASTCVAPRLAVGEMLFGSHEHLPGTPPLEFAFLSVRRGEASQRLQGIKAILDALHVRYRERVGESVDLLDRPARFVVLTADHRTTVGSTVAFAWCDEVSRWLDDETGANPAQRVISSLSPALATLPDARMFLVSSPLSTDDYHAKAFDQGETPAQCVASAATWQIVPHLLSKEDCRALADNERDFWREYGAVPSAAVSAAFDDLSGIIVKGRTHLPYRSGIKYGLTLDVGLRNDRTAAMVYHRELRKRDGGTVSKLVVDRLLLLRPTLFRKVELSTVESEVYALAKEYHIAKVHSDLHMADALAPRWRERGLTHVEMAMTVAAQERRTSKLLSRVEAATLELLDDEELIGELRKAQLRLSGGRWLVSAPERGKHHDDLLDCLLLACEHAESLPPAGGDINRSTKVRWTGDQLLVRTEYTDSLGMPTLPPEGTKDAEKARRERFARGEFTESDIDLLGEEEVSRRLGHG